jgi:hypothetical protein
LSKNTSKSINSKEKHEIYQQNEEHYDSSKTLLTLPNIQYLVAGLDALLYTNLDGDNRAKVIQLRDELTAYINSIFTDYY